MTIKMEENSF